MHRPYDDVGITSSAEWDAAYTANASPPWDIGRPQAAFRRLAQAGLLTGRLLDSGCGTGEHTLLAASHGASALGVDVAAHAIEAARRKQAERGLPARFDVADSLALSDLRETFDTVVDSGVFHVFDDGDRERYVASLASVLIAGGRGYLLCFSDAQPGDTGPRRVSKAEIVAAFDNGWHVEGIEPDEFEVRRGSELSTARAWLATVRRA